MERGAGGGDDGNFDDLTDWGYGLEARGQPYGCYGRQPSSAVIPDDILDALNGRLKPLLFYRKFYREFYWVF